MKLSFPLFVGIRYIGSKRQNQFLSFISLISLVGMVLGIVALIVVLSVMNGFESELRGRVLSLMPHAFVDFEPQNAQDWQEIAELIEGSPNVTGVAPFVGGEAMISIPGMVRGIELMAIDPQLETTVSVIDQYMIAGSLDNLQSREYGIVLGALLARHLGLTLGDALTVVVPKVSVTPVGVFPKSRRFEVVGVFEVGAQVDSSAAFIHLEDGARLFAMKGKVQGLRVQTTDLYRVKSILQPLVEKLPTKVTIKDWSQTQGSLFKAVRMEKTMIALLLAMVVAVAAFNIISILTMMVAEKRSDIAVLRTMGASPQAIMGIFVVQGMGIGVLGVLIGGVLGVLIAVNVGAIVSTLENLAGVYVFDPGVYFITSIPSVLKWLDVFYICFCAVMLSFMATLYPAWRASKIEPAEALRYE